MIKNSFSVLFVAKAKGDNTAISPFIQTQAESLQKLGLDIIVMPLKGRGLLNYIRNAIKINRFIAKKNIDIVHAHYVLVGWSMILSFNSVPKVLSLMGSDAYGEYIGENKVKIITRFSTLLTYLIQPFVSAIVCKSKNISKYVYLKNKSYILPNGVNLQFFSEAGPNKRSFLRLSQTKQYILHLGDTTDIRKNIKLAKEAVKLLCNNSVELINRHSISPSEVKDYLNNVDVFLLTSFMEGSPNVIKEAMACNCPVVATDVGDIQWVTENTDGCYTTTFEPEDVAAKLKLALQFAKDKGRTRGRERIIELGLDADSVAKKLVSIYNEVLEKNR